MGDPRPVTVYDHPLSPYGQKVKIALMEKGVPFEAPLPGNIGIGNTGGEFARVSPRGEVPALVDGDVAVFDSTIIVEYIEDRWPEPALLPPTAVDRARVRMLEDAMDTHFEAITWGMSEIRNFGRASATMVWLSGVVTYQQAEEVLRRVGHQVIPRMSIWRQGQKHGERLKRYHEHHRTAAAIERVVLSSVTPDHRRQKGISLDVGMVNIRDEGWKEFKTGTVFDVVPYEVQDAKTGEKVELAGASAVRYTAVVGDVGDFKPALWPLALDHDVPCAVRSSVTADGAAWIWNLVADDFPDSIQIVDWYHANEHLAQAAHAIYPKDTEAAQRWYQQHANPLVPRPSLENHSAPGARWFRRSRPLFPYPSTAYAISAIPRGSLPDWLRDCLCKAAFHTHHQY